MRVLGDSFGRIARVIDEDLLRQNQRIHRMAKPLDVELAIGLHKLHQVDRRKVAGRIVQEHVLSAGIRSVDATRRFAGVPTINGRIVLQARVATLVGGFGDRMQQIAGLEPLHGIARYPRPRPPVRTVHRRGHELVGDPNRVVRILEKHGGVGLPVDGRVVASVDQGMRLFLFLGLAPNELVDIRMIRVQNHHLRRPAGFAAAFDHAGEGVKALHEAQRAAGLAATGQPTVLFAQVRKVRSGAGTPLEKHPFGAGEFENRFQRILDAIDKARRALRLANARGDRQRRGCRLVVIPAGAALGFHPHVEPNRRVKRRLLFQH